MSPDPHPSETATLSALGLEKPSASGRHSPSAQAVGEVQDTAALTWLALSDLQPVPDAIWQGIQSRLNLENKELSRPVRRRWPVAAWSGWAAAALLALGWWLDPRPSPAPDGSLSTAPPIAVRTPSPASKSANPNNSIPDTETALRHELTALRTRLAAATAGTTDSPGLLRPAILELRAPGSPASALTPAESAARLQQIVTRALRRDLLLRQARDPSALILEHGWPQADWLTNVSGQTIRHLSFPADQWEELGLWKAPDRFYDPATSLIWNPAPDGLGYLGHVSPEAPDPAGFVIPPKKETPAELKNLKETAPAPSAAPAGYLVSEPGTQDATLILTDLPAAPEGTEQYAIATTADGSTQRYLIAGNQSTSTSTFQSGSNAITFPGADGSASLTGGFSVDMLTLSSLSLSGNYVNFSVVQTRADGSIPTVILSGGQP